MPVVVFWIQVVGGAMTSASLGDGGNEALSLLGLALILIPTMVRMYLSMPGEGADGSDRFVHGLTVGIAAFGATILGIIIGLVFKMGV